MAATAHPHLLLAVKLGAVSAIVALLLALSVLALVVVGERRHRARRSPPPPIDQDA